MNWYQELVTYAGLGIEYDKVLGRYTVERLQSATYLLNPRVSNYTNIVVAKDTNERLYDVTTDILDDGTIKLFGRVFKTVKPYKRIMTKDEFEENFIIITKTAGEIGAMLMERAKPR